MCIDIYVHKVLVYSDCATVTPSPTPVISPSIVPVFHGIDVPSSSQFYVPKYAPSSSAPIPNNTPSIIDVDNVLESPSAIPIINTTISPSSSNSNNMSFPFNGTHHHYIEDHAVLNIVIVVSSLVLLLCIVACKDRCRRKKVSPLHVEHKKCHMCYKKSPAMVEKLPEPTLPNSP